MKEALDLLLHFHPFLMVAIPIYLVLRFGFPGIFYAAVAFWVIGVASNEVRWTLHGEYDGTWPMLGLPIGLIYSGFLFGLLALARRFSAAYDRVSLRNALLIAGILGLLYWQFRPYGMGTSAMIRAVDTCPPDEVRFTWNEPWYFHNHGVIDLQKSFFYIGGDDESDGVVGSVTLTCGGATRLQTPLNAQQIAKIRQLVDELPFSPKLFFLRYDFTQNVYLSFWRNGSLVVRQYDRANLPQPLLNLLTTLGQGVVDEVKGAK